MERRALVKILGGGKLVLPAAVAGRVSFGFFCLLGELRGERGNAEGEEGFGVCVGDIRETVNALA